MRPIGVAMAFCLSVCGLAQGLSVAGSSGFSGGNGFSTMSGSGSIISGGRGPARGPLGVGSIELNLRVDPPSGSAPRSLTTSYHGRGSPGKSYFTRTVMDGVNHEYLGYEVLLVEQQPGTYLATFGKLPVSSLEASASSVGNDQWSIRPVALPEPRVVHDGDVIAIELMKDATTGDKLIEDLTIQPYSQRGSIGSALLGRGRAGQPPDRTVPTVEGSPRDFSSADAEMRLTQPRVTLNGTAQQAGRGTPNATGNLVWFYIPGRGRYILSLAPRPELDFQKAGEVRGGRITLKINDDAITLECFTEIATGHAPYTLYLLRDAKWEPTAQAQKAQLEIGSVAAEELAMLKKL